METNPVNDPNPLIQQQFGAHANDYAMSTVHAKGESLARLLELTQPRLDWHVLDVSTGAGHTALLFAPHVEHVIATDLTPQMLDAARKLAKERTITNIEFKTADAHALPFEDNTFDLVTNRLALHHYSDPRQAIAEMVRVCKPGGLVALVDNIVPPDKVTAGYINHFEELRDPSHNWAYSIARLQTYFTDAALQIEATEELSKEMEFEPWANRTSVSEETKNKLRDLLVNAPDQVRAFLKPRIGGDRIFFSLHEAVTIGRKT